MTLDEGLVHERVAAWARTAGTSVAVGMGGERLTYAELHGRATRLAARLRAAGAGPDHLVAVLLPRSLDLAVALLAVLEAGAAYVPLDPEHPAARRAQLLDELGVSLVVTDESRAEDVASGGRHAVRVGDRAPGEPPLDLPPVVVRPDHLAYVMFTSGSTGRPKPVGITHRGLRNHAAAIGRLLGLSPDDRVLQFANVAFDVAAEELYPTWAAGAGVVLAPPGALPAAELEEVIRDGGITLVNLPSGYFVQWTRELEAGRRGAPETLRLAVVGSEAVSGPDVRLWLRRTGIPVVNAYGVTEATITTTACRPDEEALTHAVLPVGFPVAGTEVHLLDAALRPVGPGEVGELCIGGAGLARGYHGRPGATAERFVPHPAAARPGARLYRTGDLARRSPGGRIELLGRADDQMKVRGHRVEPAEVAAALREHRQLTDAYVTRGPSAAGGMPVAYVVPRDPRRVPTAIELRTWLRGRLPEYMVPDAVVVLDALPLAPSGKVDRRALPPPPSARAAGRRHQPPRTELERTVVDLWREVLGVERLGVDDDFFQLSGNSLLAIRIVDRLRTAAGARVTLRDLLDHPTPAGLAGRIAAAAAATTTDVGAAPALPPLQPGPRRRLAPPSIQQEQLWLLSRMAPDGVAYNVQTSLRIAGPLDAGALERALTELVRRHEILRTTFEDVDGRLVQVVHSPRAAAVAREDLRHLPRERREAAAEALVEREVRRPFALDRLPLMRWTLIRVDDEEHELLLVEHHLLTDAVSFGLLRRELAALYRGAALPEPALQYADFARWQRSAVESPAVAAQLEHWRARLAGVPPPLDLPTDRPRPPRPAFRGGALRVELPGSLRRALRKYCRARRTTMFTVLLATFAALLHRQTGAGDLCVGSTFANRRQPGTEELPGLLINTVVLRWRLTAATPFDELVQRTRELVLDAWANQELPFGRLVEALNPDRAGAHDPLARVMFSFDNAPEREMDLGACSASLFERDNGSAKVDLSVVVEAPGDGEVGEAAGGDDRVILGWEYDADLFDPATIERLAGGLERLLAAALAAPPTAVGDLPLLSADERHRVLVAWNATDAPGLPGGVAELAARHAAEAPDAVAVATPDRSLTRAELERAAEGVARALRAAGIGPEARVGILAPRSPELLVAVLGALRAGAAYVPLDPDHPAGRLRFIAGDAGVRLVLADRAAAEVAAGAGFDRVVWLQDVPPAGDGSCRPARPHPGALAYVMYTSGSTGTPKGVAVEHRGVENLAAWHLRRFGLGPRDRTTMIASPGFDASAWEILPALAAGAALHVPPAAARVDPERLRDWLLERGITVSFLPTPLAEAVLQLPWPVAAPLRLLLTGGDRLRARPGAGLPFALVDNYGPTESTVVSTSGPVDAGAGRPTIGRPIDNLRTLVLDAGLRPVAPGAPGELYVGGAGLARGYLGRPDLTAERFLPSPHGAPGDRLYRTGDLARWTPAGEVDFLGRADQQVQVRGVRVEPAEVAAALATHPAVAAAEVLAVDAGGGEPRLVGYVVLRAGHAAGGEELRAHCRRLLPAHMTPAAVHRVDAMPLLASGKVDRAALAATAAPDDAASDAGAEPEGDVEARIAAIWREVLSVERVGRHDDFFALGGHSLLSARIAARLGTEFDLEVPVTIVFEHPTVAGLAGVVRPAEPAL